MDVKRIVAELDTEIAHLQHIRAALIGADKAHAGGTKAGRPKTSGAAAKSAAKKSKRVLSPEGRKRIADAMKRRWAERRKQATK